MTEPDAYRDVDGRVYRNLSKPWEGCCGVYDADSTATPLWLTEAPDPVVIAAVLAEHAGIEGYFGLDLYRNYACSCGWYSTADHAAEHRAHVAAAICAALGGAS